MKSIQGWHILVLDTRSDSNVRLRNSVGQFGCVAHRSKTIKALHAMFRQFTQIRAVLINADDLCDEYGVIGQAQRSLVDDLLLLVHEYRTERQIEHLTVGIFSGTGNAQRLKIWHGYRSVTVLTNNKDYLTLLAEQFPHERFPEPAQEAIAASA